MGELYQQVVQVANHLEFMDFLGNGIRRSNQQSAGFQEVPVQLDAGVQFFSGVGKDLPAPERVADAGPDGNINLQDSDLSSAGRILVFQ